MHHSTNNTKLPARVLATLILVIAAVVVMAAPSSASHTTTVVDIASTRDGSGYWLLYGNGRVEAHGTATWHGDGGSGAAALAVDPSGDGYWVVRSNGAIDAFGGARGLAGVDHLNLASGVIDAAPTSTGRGLWLVGGDGGIFTIGDAPFHGSTGGIALARPVVGIAPTATDDGYWLVARDGGIFSFGNAPFVGSMGGVALDRDIIAIVSSPGGGGYLMVGADGGIFTFGTMDFHGSLGGQGRTDVVGVAPLADGSGYFMATASGSVFGFGAADASSAPAGVDVESSIEAEIFDRINADRALRGLPALRWDAELAATAEAWSTEMSVSGFRHSDLGAILGGLTTPHRTAGENIYWGTGQYATSAEAHQTLMDSSGHRTAILETAYTTVGIGVRCINGKLWVTEQFGHPDTDGPVTRSGQRSRLPQVDFSGVPSTSC